MRVHCLINFALVQHRGEPVTLDTQYSQNACRDIRRVDSCVAMEWNRLGWKNIIPQTELCYVEAPRSSHKLPEAPRSLENEGTDPKIK